MATQASGHRIEIRPADVKVKVSLDGVILAETSRPVVLHETGIAPRYYIAAEDVRMDLLTPTESETKCPFKGTASYWSVNVGGDVVKDLVWSYPDPIPEARDIAGLLCFYNEKVDLEVDGEVLPRPTSRWS